MPFCDEIRVLSEDVYDRLSNSFSFRYGFSVLGLTDWFVYSLAQVERLFPSYQVQIYKMPWTVESLWGNDIDLFIQNRTGAYDWYALQAKGMSFNGAFRDLKVVPNVAQQQWEKLIAHEHTFGSKAFYLLYTGLSQRPPNTSPTRSDCLGVPRMEELGLGIVEAAVVANIRANQLREGQLFYYRHVFPDHVDSIRKLFCCDSLPPRTSKQFQLSEIDTTGYIKVVYNEVPEDLVDATGGEGLDEVEEPIELPKGCAPIRIIVTSDEGRTTKQPIATGIE